MGDTRCAESVGKGEADGVTRVHVNVLRSVTSSVSVRDQLEDASAVGCGVSVWTSVEESVTDESCWVLVLVPVSEVVRVSISSRVSD